MKRRTFIQAATAAVAVPWRAMAAQEPLKAGVYRVDLLTNLSHHRFLNHITPMAG